MSQLTRALHEQLKRTDRPLIKEGEQWYTRNQVQLEIKRIKGLLLQAGVQKGDRILLGLPNSYSFFCIFLAVIDYGAVVAAINPKMTDEELIRFTKRCRPVSGFVLEPHADVLMNTQMEQSILSLLVYRTSGCDANRYLCNSGLWFQVRHAEDVRDYKIADEPTDEAEAILLYTSGTTGDPKAVGLTHGQVYAAVQHIIESHQLSETDRAYNVLPLFHINAQVVTVLSTCLSGGQIVMESKFSATKFWNTIIREHITWVSAVPAIISIVLKIAKPERIPETIRFFRSASAPLDSNAAVQFEHDFGIPLIQSYGMTEACSQICVNPLPPKTRVAGSVGIPYGLELRIVDDVDHELTLGEAGEIVIRGSNIITQYADGSGKDSFHNGWFHTGDVGRVNHEGYVFIVGRKKELINHGGEKVSPYEVEQVIRCVPGIRQVAVIGLDDSKYGERVAAYVVTDEAAAESPSQLKETIINQCKHSLSSYKWPALVEFVHDIPTGPTGKVQRSQLKSDVLNHHLEKGSACNHA